MGYPAYVSTTNACRMCTPLGACIAFKGVEGAVPFLHGSQGCATYMRRYIISHFREPIDVASSALGEKQAVYGGGPNLKQGLLNVIEKYSPEVVGIATTCLTETIGDDVRSIVGEFVKEQNGKVLPKLVRVSTPSYQGSHVEGFHATVHSLVEQLALEKHPEKDLRAINLFPGLVSPEDIRHLVELAEDFGLAPTVLPDYSETLDGPAMREYAPIAPGGTPVGRIGAMGANAASFEFGATLNESTKTPAAVLEERHEVERIGMGMPIGLRNTDKLFGELGRVSGKEPLHRHILERGRLIDAFVDGHKYLSGKRAALFGDEDLIVGLASFLAEIGIQPVLCATGGKSGKFKGAIKSVTDGLVREEVKAIDGVDFHEIAHETEGCVPDLLIGTSKGYHLAKKLDLPLVRVGFPIHDRFGGQRTLHLGYRGALSLLDRLINAIIERKQYSSDVGYSYL